MTSADYEDVHCRFCGQAQIDYEELRQHERKCRGIDDGSLDSAEWGWQDYEETPARHDRFALP